MSDKYKILFVCLGNICRSPAAEGIFRQMVEKRGLGEKLEADSAGTYAGHTGEQPDSRMRNAAYARGYLLTHRARQVRLRDFEEFDRIVQNTRQPDAQQKHRRTKQRCNNAWRQEKFARLNPARPPQNHHAVRPYVKIEHRNINRCNQRAKLAHDGAHQRNSYKTAI